MTAMPLEVLQRHTWTGQPIRLGSMFTVTKGRRAAETTAAGAVLVAFTWIGIPASALKLV